MGLYIYQRALDDKFFRTLTLHPGRGQQTVVCSLETLAVDVLHDLDLNPFEALSYAWGDENVTSEIVCDSQRLLVTEELGIALINLRNEDTPRRLWIDQICINQKDLEERSAQVMIMGDIYRSAKSVVVWLGAESENSDFAIEFIPQLNDGLSAYEEHFPKRAILYDDFGKILEPTNYKLPPAEGPEWTSITDLFSRRWFGRLWIVQEVLSNDDVNIQCGKKQLPWQAVEQLIAHSNNHVALSPLLFRHNAGSCHRLVDGIIYARPRLRTAKIESIIEWFSEQNATEAHDRIYALLSLAEKQESDFVVPAYSKTAAEVYTEFARNLILRKNRKNLLNLVQLNNNSRVGAPSWAPDWMSISSMGKNTPVKMTQDSFHASRSGQESWHFINGDNILRVRGRRIDWLGAQGMRFPMMDPESNQEEKDWLENEEKYTARVSYFLNDARELANSCTRYPDLESDMLLCLTCIRSVIRAEKPKVTLKGLVQILRDFIDLLQPYQLAWKLNRKRDPDSRNIFDFLSNIFASKEKADSSPPEQPRQDLDASDVAWNFNCYFTPELKGNAIVKTRSGFLVNGTQQCQEGDIVAILYGWDTPFILRPVPSGYLLVGECYVHGMMYGEANEQEMGVELDFNIL